MLRDAAVAYAMMIRRHTLLMRRGARRHVCLCHAIRFDADAAVATIFIDIIFVTLIRR